MKTEFSITNQYNPYLVRIFSNNVISDLVQDKHSNLLSEILNNSGLLNNLDINITLREFFDTAYKYLFKTYRSEYIFKNAIANKILLGKHSLNTSIMLTEFRVANCKADTVILNGTSNVYEIKTEYDSLDRLDHQITAYENFFDRIYVITISNQVNKVIKAVSDNIGIIIYTNRNTIRKIRDAKSNKENVKPEVIFDSLRKNEYCDIIKDKFGSLPEVPNTRIYSMYKDVFCKLSPCEAHDSMVNVLMKSRINHSLKEFILENPFSLKAYALKTSLSKKDQKNFINILDKRLTNFLDNSFVRR